MQDLNLVLAKFNYLNPHPFVDVSKTCYPVLSIYCLDECSLDFVRAPKRFRTDYTRIFFNETAYPPCAMDGHLKNHCCLFYFCTQ